MFNRIYHKAHTTFYDAFINEHDNKVVIPAFGFHAQDSYKKSTLEGLPNTFKKIPAYLIDYLTKGLSYFPSISIVIGIARIIFINFLVKDISPNERIMHNFRALNEILRTNKLLLILDTIVSITRYVQHKQRSSISI